MPIFGRILLYRRDLSEWRPLAQPIAERVQRLTRAAGQDFDITAVEIDRVARDAEPLRFAPCAVTKPHALHAATNGKPSGFLR